MTMLLMLLALVVLVMINVPIAVALGVVALGAMLITQGAHMLPNLTTSHVATPSPQLPFGAKGAGEAGNIGAPPAIVNAVLDALSPLGVTAVDQPLHDERIWRLIHDSKHE